MSGRRVVVLAALLAAAIGSLPVVAQVKTNVPDVVAGARPAIVERITIHGTALEGNLEGNAVDRDAIHVAVRFQEHVMPFFSRALLFAPAKR